ncbi:glucosamine-6-phosphate deaminase [Salipaludibacillus agaradhaerens]|uniref:glucosamine-6-phosphate deaminase n=1 Tax=Salipaludibacillus agaradhaerens TaxID=76935 RepID=UPI002150A4BA|nr:glucosamine-6-phosphate deaminase [Salipaludibacillus agaradhaerens]MCR6105297.1 glucosamine-6-phosphate deaminase [Salipaludibacillus agaradhaerens]MCR6117338.1 glucosamine-6-phosphate deaminase [Salipaludibacillus agaradhaerens]UJW56541.1 glucosamine-6-phosphate deaminase [Bacillus sp. A116_S68]
MKIIKVANYEAMSIEGADHILTQLIKKRLNVLGLATGGTPEGLYQILREKINEKALSLNHLHTVNLDEYIGLPADSPASYHYYMQDIFFKHIPIPKENTHLPNGYADDVVEECTRYEELIESLGGVDLQLLGIGQNGHIGFNEPGSPFNGRTRIVDLAPSTIEANARYFSSKNDVPRQAITMGIKTIMKSRQILLLASGKEKAEAVKALIEGDQSDDIPATALQGHPHLTVIADEAALSGVTRTFSSV